MIASESTEKGTSAALPFFEYHPDPVSTGAITASHLACRCCGCARGYVYTGTLHCIAVVDSICPWCIADGSAALKFDGTFADAFGLADAGVSHEVIETITHRTPGYESWQGEEWQACCADACEFHGDAPADEIRLLTLAQIRHAMQCPGIDEEYARRIASNYKPIGNPAFYKWRCRHCRKIIYSSDST